MAHMRKSYIAAVTCVFVLSFATAAQANSAYLIGDHHTRAFDAWNINPDGTLTKQAVYTLSWDSRDPSGLALYEGFDASDNLVTALFVTTEFNDTVEVVDPITMTHITTLHVGVYLDGGIAVDVSKNLVYAVSRGGSVVHVFQFDPTAKTLTPVPGTPFTLPNMVGAVDVKVDESNNRIYVSDIVAGKLRGYDVSALNSITEVWTFTPSQFPVGIALDRGRQKLYSTAPDYGCAYIPGWYTPLNRLIQIDLATNTETFVSLGSHGGMGIAVDEVSGFVYVTGGCLGDDVSIWTSSLTAVGSTGPIGNPAGIVIGKVSYNPLNFLKTDGLAGNACAPVQGNATYALCFDNSKNLAAVTGVTLIDDLPFNATFVSATGGGVYDAATHKVSWFVGNVAAGAPPQCVQVTVHLTSGALAGSTVVNHATIDGDQTPPTTVVEQTPVCAYTPLAAYGFNEPSGLVAIDSAGGDNNGELKGGVTRRSWYADPWATYLEFDGVNDLVMSDDFPQIRKAVSVMAWVCPFDPGNGWQTVAMKQNGHGLAFGLYSSNDLGKPAGYVAINYIDRKVQGPATVPGCSWFTHLAMTYDGVAMKLYVNGNLAAQKLQTGLIMASYDFFQIGGNLMWGEFFKGYIEDVRLYDVAIPEAQVKADMGTPVQ